MQTVTTWIRTCLLTTVVISLCSCSAGESSSGAGKPSEKSGSKNEAIVLLAADSAGSWPAGLDPATSPTAGMNLSLMNAIYGGLFQLTTSEDGSDPHVIGVLASGYEMHDGGRTLVIHLRDGLHFSDGTPFDAEAVRFNMERNMKSPCGCAPTRWPWVEENKVTVENPVTVSLHFTQPYPSAINALPISNLNWIASSTAIRTLGDQFRMKPVGAGPFRVVSNQLSSQLILERNPAYWDTDKPYLDRLVFMSIGNEQAAYLSLLSGDATAVEGITSPQIIARAASDGKVAVTRQQGTSPYVVQLNTAVPPFNDKRAREAIYYATDSEAIRKGLFGDAYPATQSFTSSAGLFHHAKIPGYREYDLDRARALVKAVGGINLKIGTLKAAAAEQVITALQSQWQKAGMNVTLETYELATLSNEFRGGTWQAMLQTAGSYEPEAGVGVKFRFYSTQPFSGVHDKALDQILDEAAATADSQERDALYYKVARHISDNAYAPFLFAFGPTQLSAHGIMGPGLTTLIPPLNVNTSILWQDVRIAHE
jgi:peptide/nickel transport system substrate-binding protein